MNRRRPCRPSEQGWDPFAYIFRFCCDPGFNDEAEIAALREYVQCADVDDVAVFANVEELNTGHMEAAEQDVYVDLVRRVQQALAPLGVSVSVNQWHSVMHADLGKALPESQPFRPMVDVNGRAARLCVCPLCETWQAYIAALYARYAALEPSILWVEDDFRLHNHEPLAWGGCFCEEHMRLYSARAGKRLTREEFIRGVLQPGPPHPYRKIWLDVSRETMLCAARAIGGAVRAVSAAARVGLMSSAPHVHCAEGRDWPALVNALAAGAAPVDRIHLPGYQEQAPGAYLQGFHMVSMLTRAMLPADTQVYPELENYPFSLYAKSRRFTRFQLISSLALAPAGITIDLYDLNGNGIVWQDGYQDMLRQVKPFLNAAVSTGRLAGRRLGVQVLYSPDASYHLHTAAGRHMEELYPQEVFWAGLLGAMGVPFAYCDDPASLHGQVAAVSGQALRNWDARTLEALFRNNVVLLTGDAADTLCQMGLGHLAGMESLRWMTQNEGEYTFEQAEDGRVYTGRPRARASAVISAADAAHITYLPGAQVEVRTAFYDSFRRRRAPAQAVVEGRVLVYPFGHFEGPLAIPPMLLSHMRAQVLHGMLADAGFAAPLAQGGPYLAAYAFEGAEGALALYLVNGALDGVRDIRLAGAPAGPVTVLCSARPEEGPRPAAVGPDGRLEPPLALPALEGALICWGAPGQAAQEKEKEGQSV